MPTKLQIANKALRRLGQAPIQSLSETSAARLAIDGVWDMLYDEVLAGHPWNCALQRLQLPASNAAPAFGWTAQFPLPGDPYVLRVWQTGDDPRRPVPYKTEGRMVLADQTGSLAILAIVRVANPLLLSPWCADQIACELAFEIAYQLTASTEKEDAARKHADRRLVLNRSLDGQEGTPDDIAADDFLRSRL